MSPADSSPERYHVFGDLHGCHHLLLRAFERLGYRRRDEHGWDPPAGVRAVFLGDLVDRGPDSVGCVQTVRRMVEAGTALAVAGNHEDKLLRCLRYMAGETRAKPPVSSGRARTLWELLSREEVIPEARTFVEGLPTHLILDEGRLVVVHAAWSDHLDRLDPAERRRFLLYGPVETDGAPRRFPPRLDWTLDYEGDALVVWGHQIHDAPHRHGSTINIDQGCCRGGSLSVLDYPSLEIHSVPSDIDYRRETPLLEAMRDGVRHAMGLDSVEGGEGESEEGAVAAVRGLWRVRKLRPDLVTPEIATRVIAGSTVCREYEARLRSILDVADRLVARLVERGGEASDSRAARKRLALAYGDAAFFPLLVQAHRGVDGTVRMLAALDAASGPEDAARLEAAMTRELAALDAGGTGEASARPSR